MRQSTQKQQPKEISVNQLMAFVLCVLGSKAIIDVWFKGSIFAWHRAWAELMRDEGKWWLTRKFGELMTCRFCFSYHSSLWLSLLCIPLLPWWMLIPWWLAVRTSTAFLDLFEEKLERTEENGNQATTRVDDGTHASSSGESLFD
jgi:hypothetical protein